MERNKTRSSYMGAEIKKKCDMYGEIYKVTFTETDKHGFTCAPKHELFTCEEHARRVAKKVHGYVSFVRVRLPIAN